MNTHPEKRLRESDETLEREGSLSGASPPPPLTSTPGRDGMEPLLHWREFLEEFDSNIENGVSALRENDPVKGERLLAYLDGCLRTLTETFYGLKDALPLSEVRLGEHVLKTSPAIVIRLKNKLRTMKETGRGCILIFSPIEYTPTKVLRTQPAAVRASSSFAEGRRTMSTSNTLVNHTVVQPSMHQRRNVVPHGGSETTRQVTSNVGRLSINPTPASRGSFQNSREGRMPYSVSSEDSLLERELELYQTLPPPWNETPFLIPRKNYVDVGRYISSAETRFFNGDIDRYSRWRADFLNNLGAVQCLARYKVSALCKALHSIIDTLTSRDTPDFDGYRAIIVALEDRFGNRYILTRRFETYFEGTGSVTYGNLIAFEEYRVKVEQFRQFLESPQGTTASADYLYEKLLRPLAERYIEEYGTWLVATFKEESVSSLGEWITCRIRRLRRYQIQQISRKPDPGKKSRVTLLTESQIPLDSASTLEEPLEDEDSEEQILLNKARVTLRDDCPLGCESDHHLDACPRFAAIAVAKRKAIMFNWRLTFCFRCLGRGHVSNKCQQGTTCDVCAESHHTLLHPEDDRIAARVQMAVTLISNLTSLPTLSVLVSSKKLTIKVAAIIDTGSTITILKESVAKQLGLTGPKIKLTLQTARGAVIQPAFLSHITIAGKETEKGWSIPIVIFYDSDLFDNLSSPMYLGDWNHLRHIPFDRAEGKEIALLIGNDVSYLTAVKESVVGKGLTEPIGEQSLLGWSIRGPIQPSRRTGCEVLSLDGAILEEQETFSFKALERRMEEAWDLPFNSIEERRLRAAEKEASTILQKTLKLDLRKRSIEGGILWKDGTPPLLPNNRLMAERRYRALQKLLNRDAIVRAKYEENLKDWIDTGKLIRAMDAEEGRIHYLCHFPVVRLDKDTSQVRTVVDASASYLGSSLNDHIHPGPNLCNDVRKVLLRFRREKIAFMADVKGMFLQIKLKKEDQSYHRLLWSFGTEPPQTWQFTCFCFGNTCSPAVAISATHKIAETIPSNVARARDSILHSTVMDDTVDSASSEEEAVKILEALHAAYARASMELRKFASNSDRVLSQFPRELIRSPSSGIPLDGSLEQSPLKTLGVIWWPKEDSFSINLAFIPNATPLSRRIILSLLAQIYDPLGLIAPLLIALKHLVQSTWQLSIAWDDELPPQLLHKWNQGTAAITGHLRLPIPRALADHPLEIIERELHIFADASSIAYGAVAYLVSSNPKSGSTNSVLVASKARVAPLKYSTIPRLELQAACIGADLAQMIIPALRLEPGDVHYWTDSQDVMYWLHSSSRTLKVFVSNRIAQLQSTTWIEHWKWTPTKSNPSDIISRGATLESLRTNGLWWYGPDFLLDKAKEPQQPEWKVKSKPLKELRKLASNVLIVSDVDPTSMLSRLLSQTRDWKKLVRIVIIIYKWLKNSENSTLTSEAVLLKLIQREEWPQQVRMLLSGKKLPAGDRLHQFDPFLDSSGIIRIQGRLAYIDYLPWESRFPVLLPATSSATISLVQHYHTEHLQHLGGIRNLQSKLAEKYHIIRGRELAKRIVQKCVTCRRTSVRGALPEWAPLPPYRVPGPTRTEAFQTVAIDIMGPFLVMQEGLLEKKKVKLTNRGRPKKFDINTEYQEMETIRVRLYILAFSCLRFRATHLEIIHSLKPEDVFLAIDRFLVIRNRPTQIISDNGTNFIATNRLLTPLWNKLREKAKHRHPAIHWTFTIPGAAHTNGAVERIIGLAKIALGKALRNRKITLNEMATAIKLVEGSLNNRPLQALNGIEDNHVLTPNHFLRGSPFNTFAPADETLDHLTSWKKINDLIEVYWRRFVKEIVPTLNLGKRHSNAKNRNWKTGDIVIVKDVSNVRPELNFPHWPIARILAIYPGPDGIVRSVKLRINQSEYIRNVSFIAPLLPELENENSNFPPEH